jgi:predicted nucleic-acid-binding protein
LTALDTNVLVRVVTADDPEQLAVALEVLRSGPLFVPKTVLLETEWVLRYCYKLTREAALGALRKIVGYRSLAVEDRSAVLRALTWSGQGMDFADALHLASSSAAERFATFDRTLAEGAEAAGAAPAVQLLSGRNEP